MPNSVNSISILFLKLNLSKNKSGDKYVIHKNMYDIIDILISI